MMIRRCIPALACVASTLVSFAASAQGPIKIGFPIPLSGPTAIYGQPILQGAQMAVAEINAAGGLLGRQVELLPRDSKANPDEAVRVSRELIVKDNVDFLAGTLTSAEAPAVSTIAKENHVVFIAPAAKLTDLTSPPNLHPYIFRVSSTTLAEGRTAAAMLAKWQGVKRVATIAPDYAYGRQAIADFIDYLKTLRPDIQIVDQEWPKLGEPNLTPFLTAQMSKHPDAVMCDEFGGDFVTLVKQGTPLGYFKAINNRLIDGGEVGSVDVAKALGDSYPFGIWSDAYDPVIWNKGEPPEHKVFEQHLLAFMHSQYGSGWAIQGYIAVEALAAGVKKADSVDDAKVAHALLGLTIQTPIGTRTFSPVNHDFNTGEVWGEMVKDPQYPFAIINNPTYENPTQYMN
jgi:branched-chain amino acid transport system substrate-binding protein